MWARRGRHVGSLVRHTPQRWRLISEVSGDCHRGKIFLGPGVWGMSGIPSDVRTDYFISHSHLLSRKHNTYRTLWDPKAECSHWASCSNPSTTWNGRLSALRGARGWRKAQQQPCHWDHLAVLGVDGLEATIAVKTDRAIVSLLWWWQMLVFQLKHWGVCKQHTYFSQLWTLEF